MTTVLAQGGWCMCGSWEEAFADIPLHTTHQSTTHTLLQSPAYLYVP